MDYTEEQLEWMFNAYEKVRRKGTYNMFSKEAMWSTGLTYENYIYVMENYSELRERFSK